MTPVGSKSTAHDYRSFWCLLCTANFSMSGLTVGYRVGHGIQTFCYPRDF